MTNNDLIESLNEEIKEKTGFRPWCCLPYDAWYKVRNVSTFEDCLGLELTSLNEDETFKVFATSIVKKELNKTNNKNNIYIRSLGMHEEKNYYKFDLIERAN